MPKGWLVSWQKHGQKDLKLPQKVFHAPESADYHEEGGVKELLPICLKCKKPYAWKDGGAFICYKCLPKEKP